MTYDYGKIFAAVLCLVFLLFGAGGHVEGAGTRGRGLSSYLGSITTLTGSGGGGPQTCKLLLIDAVTHPLGRLEQMTGSGGVEIDACTSDPSS